MKSREGFVSNSSSCSFTVLWKDKLTNDITSSIKRLLDVYDEDDLINDVDITNIIDHTNLIDGKYTSNFFTSMYNDYKDVPRSMRLLVSSLTLNESSGFELIYIFKESE